MDFKHQMTKTSFTSGLIAAAVMGVAYAFGGILPMIPYFAMKNITHALFVSCAVAFVQMSIFGFLNGYKASGSKLGGLRTVGETLIVGILAAGCSYRLAQILNHAI